MAKVRITSKWDIIPLVNNLVDQTTATTLGDAIVGEAKELIRNGISPVRGHGRFAAYKDRKKYPGDLKSARPVNLFLTGDMLRGFGFKLGAKNTVEVGMVNGSSFAKEKAEAHNAGTRHMAQRRFVPGPKEEWAVSIMRKIRDVYEKRLGFLIRQANK